MLNDRRMLAPLSRIQDTLPDAGHGSTWILTTDGLEAKPTADTDHSDFPQSDTPPAVGAAE